MAIGRVKDFSDEDGWGVLTSPEVPGDVWMHFSSLEMPGYRAVAVGQEVEFDWIRVEQDGYHYRAERVKPLQS
jgi:CspA family cold shock protein